VVERYVHEKSSVLGRESSGSWVGANERLSAVMANFDEVHTTIQRL